MDQATIKTAIDAASTIYLASHMNPDGDNLGSLLGTYHVLKDAGKDVTFLLIDEVPDNLQFLPGLQEGRHEGFESVDLFIALDCADRERLGDLSEVFDTASVTINIDHHKTNTRYADINYVDGDSPATCELVYNLFKTMEYKVSVDAATCLYTGLSTDTGSFKYDSVSKGTFLTAADLVDLGADVPRIGVELYQNRSLQKTKLLFQAMSTLELYYDNQLALVHVTDADIEAIGANKMDSEGIVEFIRDIAGVEAAVLIKEKYDSCRLSVRTKSFLNATDVVKPYGGGGHIRAAGATMDLPWTDRRDEIVQALEGVLSERGTSY
ncbi:bifunctional oligoribonuclease/PAP phosphatase NrnA [Peptoniphilus equinus]|uniref:Bifunctional oligoribonuclease/PAP phosphatase NrnA n=1 Tax=Peptoniphilus equinus TaxID=3016343 RepID=A0ABY7QX56_9FIRM|nr:bifunctional oligoribonuclease/PAP phosphatase NrnA [Peptoniphilus equinus]WBW50680.1 bifunctional oligoribonuclease/PAP phosphatase NrnA [Peptoniphilus equinus]